ncbi:MAG: exopolysaccharide biosynthesis polyprenyl glycosylphosphotransferase [Pseudomonadota bacterium]
MYAFLILGDVAALCLTLALVAGRGEGWFLTAAWQSIAYAAVPIYLAAAANLGAYSMDSLLKPSTGVWRAGMAAIFTLLTLLLAGFFLSTVDRGEWLSLILAMLLAPVAIFGGRYIVRSIGAHLFASRYFNEIVIRDGSGIEVPAHAIEIDASQANLKPDPMDPMMLDRLARILRGADRVVVACPPEAQRQWSSLLKGANVRGEVIAREFEAVSAIGIDQLAGRTTLVVASGPLGPVNRLLKRGLDLALTIPALALLAPVLLMIAIAIKLDSPGPILFRQNRVGRGNALFAVFKFRSMRADSCDAAGRQSTERNDSRITRVGRFIRRTSLDELPQLFNVLNGSMSLVGPRPHALGSLAGQQFFWEVDERYWHRHALKPGITGLAQVRGFRGATHRRDDLTRRLQADLEYMSGWTIWRDVWILFKTARVIIHPNAY